MSERSVRQLAAFRASGNVFCILRGNISSVEGSVHRGVCFCVALSYQNIVFSE